MTDQPFNIILHDGIPHAGANWYGRPMVNDIQWVNKDFVDEVMGQIDALFYLVDENLTWADLRHLSDLHDKYNNSVVTKEDLLANVRPST